MTWSNNTKLPVTDPLKKSVDFKLGMDLLYRNGEGKSVHVFYKGDSTNGLLHTLHIKEGSNLNVYSSDLQLIDQSYLSNITKTPINYRNDVGTVLSLDYVQALARPSALSTL